MSFRTDYKPRTSFSSGFVANYKTKPDLAAVNRNNARNVRELVQQIRHITDELRAATGRRGDDIGLLNASLVVGSFATGVLMTASDQNEKSRVESADTAKRIDNVFKYVASHYPGK